MRMNHDFTEQENERLAALSEALSPWQTVLSLSQVLALAAIARTPGLSVNELAENLGLPQQTVSRHVAILLGRYQTSPDMPAGSMATLIRQKISATDPRRRALFLSDDGVALIKALTSDTPANRPSTTNPGGVK
jgi:DNA-binding MarR family transcriptional regulator